MNHRAVRARLLVLATVAAPALPATRPAGAWLQHCNQSSETIWTAVELSGTPTCQNFGGGQDVGGGRSDTNQCTTIWTGDLQQLSPFGGFQFHAENSDGSIQWGTDFEALLCGSNDGFNLCADTCSGALPSFLMWIPSSSANYGQYNNYTLTFQ